jgi:transposase-like protein
MNNKIIEIQEMLFKEIKRLSEDDILEKSKETTLEFQRSNNLYNISTAFVKTLNTNLSIRQIAKREGTRCETLMSELGLTDEE